MTDYTKSTNFASKDSLLSGNPLKIVKGTEIDTEFNNIATAVATKADKNNTEFTGTTTVVALSVSGDTAIGGDTTIGGNASITGNSTIAGTASITGDLSLGGKIILEGATADDYETTLQVTDPTADRTITFQDKTGTVALTSDIGTTSIASITGTYAASSSSTVTVSITSHGRSVGDVVFLDFTSGTATDNQFTVASVVNDNSYTVNYGSTITASGNVTQYYSPLGQIRIASITEVLAGTNTNKAITPYAYQNTKFGSMTAVATTSGTTVEFTSIPSWAKKITVIFSGVSLAATDDICIQLSTSGGYVTSGYKCGYGTMAGTGSSRDTSFVLADSITSSQIMGGAATLYNVGSNDWSGTATTTRYSSNGFNSAFSISLGGTLTAIKVFTVSGTAFDAGLVNILYE